MAREAAKRSKSQALPEVEQEALRQVFYGKDSPGNLPAELIRSLYNVPAHPDRARAGINAP